MLNAGVEGLGRRVLREPEDIAAPDTSQPPGPGDQQEAQGPHAAQDVAVRALAGAAPGSGDGVELEAAGDVVGQDAELLPGAVGAVVAGGDDIEGELALEFGDGLLLRAPVLRQNSVRRQVIDLAGLMSPWRTWPCATSSPSTRTRCPGRRCAGATDSSGSRCRGCGRAGGRLSSSCHPTPSCGGSGAASASTGPSSPPGPSRAALPSMLRSRLSSHRWLRPIRCGAPREFTGNAS